MTGGECKQLSLDNGGSRAKENQCNIEKILFFNTIQTIMIVAILISFIILLIRRKKDD